jgi:predicted enzyme related to lactoylglutathione lyase
MLDFKSIMIFSEDPDNLAKFYEKVFAREAEWVDNGYHGFMVGQGVITIGPHDKVKGKNKNPERIMINFETNNVEKDFKSIEALGAKVIAKPYSPGDDDKMLIATFEDPDGNIFQIATPWEEMN